jgi:hypothetical protein
VGIISRASQDSRTLVRFVSQVGEHSGGSGGCFAYSGSGGICTDLTGKLGSGAGGVAQPDSHSSTSSAINCPSLTNGFDFSRVSFVCIGKLLFCGAAFGFFGCAGFVGGCYLLGIGCAAFRVCGLLGLQPGVADAVGQHQARDHGGQQPAGQ